MTQPLDSQAKHRSGYVMKCGYCGLMPCPPMHVCESMPIGSLTIAELRRLIRDEIKGVSRELLSKPPE